MDEWFVVYLYSHTSKILSRVPVQGRKALCAVVLEHVIRPSQMAKKTMLLVLEGSLDTERYPDGIYRLPFCGLYLSSQDDGPYVRVFPISPPRYDNG